MIAFRDSRAIAELLASADALPETGRTRKALTRIECSAGDDAVSVTVDLGGKLVGLDLADRAMDLASADLAARIKCYAAEAAAAAQAEGMEVLADSCGQDAATAIAELMAATEREPEADAEEDFTPESWAIPWDQA